VMHQNRYALDIQEAKKSNIMISGLTGSGKTRLAWAHAAELVRAGFQVIVIDPIGVWKDSPIPYTVKITPIMRQPLSTHLDLKSVVLDTSRLIIGDQLVFLDLLSKHIFHSRVDQAYPKQTMIIIEECSTFIKNLRSEVAQNIYRLAMTGRNYGVRLMYIDPRLNSIPAEFRFLAGQQFHGFANEVNILNKIKRLHGKEWEQVMKTLNVGEFIRTQAGQDPTKIRVPLYTPTSKPVELKEQPNTPPNHTTHNLYQKPTHTQSTKHDKPFKGQWMITFTSTLILFLMFWGWLTKL